MSYCPWVPEILVHEKMWWQARVGRGYHGVSFDAIPDDATYKQGLKVYLDNITENILAGLGLVIYGPYRSGKTAAACLTIKKVLARGGTALFAMCSDLPYLVMEEKWYDEENGITWEQRMRTVDLLVIDDFGMGTPGQWEKTLFERTYRFRAANYEPTIITTNLTNFADGVKILYGAPLLHLFAETTTNLLVECLTWHAERIKAINKMLRKDGGCGAATPGGDHVS